jgi:hypothetical protein
VGKSTPCGLSFARGPKELRGLTGDPVEGPACDLKTFRVANFGDFSVAFFDTFFGTIFDIFSVNLKSIKNLFTSKLSRSEPITYLGSISI